MINSKNQNTVLLSKIRIFMADFKKLYLCITLTSCFAVNLFASEKPSLKIPARQNKQFCVLTKSLQNNLDQNATSPSNQTATTARDQSNEIRSNLFVSKTSKTVTFLKKLKNK